MRLNARAFPLLALSASAALLVNCGTGGFPEQDAAADRQVVLYLYPPASSQIPAQVRTDLNLRSDTGGVVNLDTGIVVTGQLSLPTVNENGIPGEQAITGQLTATDVDGFLSYSAQFNLTDATFQLLVPQGSYNLTISATGSTWHVPPQKFTDVDISALNGGTLELAPLDPGLPLQVTLEYADGQPVTGAQVFTLDPDGALSSTIVSAGQGVYWIQVAHDAQTLWMGPDPDINPSICNTQIRTLSVGEGTPDLEPVTYVYTVSSHKLTGRVTDTLATAVAGATVFATREPDPTNAFEGAYKAQTITDSQGQFQLQLPDGSYDLLFRAPTATATPLSGVRYQSTVVLTQDVKLADDVTLPPMLPVDVVVKGPDGSPVAGAVLTVVSDDQANRGTSGVTDDNGFAALTLGLGDYLLEVAPSGDSELVYQVLAISVTASTTVMPDIMLETGFMTNIRFLVDGAPIEGMIVKVWELASDGSAPDSPIHLLAATDTDADGNARLVLPPE